MASRGYRKEGYYCSLWLTWSHYELSPQLVNIASPEAEGHFIILNITLFISSTFRGYLLNNLYEQLWSRTLHRKHGWKILLTNMEQASGVSQHCSPWPAAATVCCGWYPHPSPTLLEKPGSSSCSAPTLNVETGVAVRMREQSVSGFSSKPQKKCFVYIIDTPQAPRWG